MPDITIIHDHEGNPIALESYSTRHSVAALLQAAKEADELRQRVAGLHAWMRRYGQHPPECAAALGERCTCGLALLRGEA